MAPTDFPRAARSLGISGVEYVNQFYQNEEANSPWIATLRSQCAGEGVRSHLIMCDGEGDLGAVRKTERMEAVARHQRWIDAAHELGCHAIRVNARSTGTPEEQRELLADGLHALCEMASSAGLRVLVENHGGPSSDGDWLASVLAAVGHPAIGSLPDFGNFRRSATDWAPRYQGVAALLPWAGALSAKSYDFDTVGNETTIDYRRMLMLARSANYRGAIGIEYEGRRLDERSGILATKALLERVIATMDSGGNG
jgi:L-ribulose-5-phosphate 3-epimerase